MPSRRRFVVPFVGAADVVRATQLGVLDVPWTEHLDRADHAVALARAAGLAPEAIALDLDTWVEHAERTGEDVGDWERIARFASGHDRDAVPVDTSVRLLAREEHLVFGMQMSVLGVIDDELGIDDDAEPTDELAARHDELVADAIEAAEEVGVEVREALDDLADGDMLQVVVTVDAPDITDAAILGAVDELDAAGGEDATVEVPSVRLDVTVWVEDGEPAGDPEVGLVAYALTWAALAGGSLEVRRFTAASDDVTTVAWRFPGGNEPAERFWDQ